MLGAPPQRVALVTGANRGIGCEIARQLGKAGLTVIVAARDVESGDAAAARLGEEGIEAAALELEVTRPESVAAAMGWVGERFGRLDALVNNAGIAIDHRDTALGVDLDKLSPTFETNLLGPWRLARAAVPLMQRHGYGRIVNVSSGRGSFTKLAADGPCYRLSKTALNALTVMLADELRDTNILVNAMTPGWVRTRLGGINAPRSTAEGAETAVWLACLPDDGPRGLLFKDREVFPW